MKTLLVATVALFAATTAAGGPTERAILAAMRLSEQPNYRWSSSVTDDARSYFIEGKTQRGGLTWMRLPMVKSVAQRLGRAAEPDVEAWFLGPAASVIRTDRGWQSLDELPRRHRDWRDDTLYWPAVGAVSAGRGTIGAVDPWSVPHATFGGGKQEPFSIAQFALGLPHEDLAVLIGTYADLQVSGDTATGVLSDAGAQLLLVRDGEEHIEPLRAAGTFRLQIERGQVVKYFLRLEGILRVDRKRVHVRQTSVTTLSDIDSTRLDVPYEAQRKLAAMR